MDLRMFKTFPARALRSDVAARSSYTCGCRPPSAGTPFTAARRWHSFAATAQHGAQQALTQSHTSPASPLQQAPMDVAESQETLAGPSQQAPMDVTESQETLPGPSQQASMDVATMLDIQPGPSQAFQLTPVSFISSCVVSIQVYSLHEVGCRCNSAM
ncbi:uncharacterized protein LOC144109490 [Amblyomma americanum]